MTPTLSSYPCLVASASSAMRLALSAPAPAMWKPTRTLAGSLRIG